MFGLGITTKAIIAGVILAIAGMVGLWFKSVFDDNQQLQANNAVLQQAIAVQDATIGRLQMDIQRQNDILTATNAELDDIRTTAAQNAFDGHDLPKLIHHKPGLVENILNEGIADYYNAFNE